jgi:hypothetical protein
MNRNLKLFSVLALITLGACGRGVEPVVADDSAVSDEAALGSCNAYGWFTCPITQATCAYAPPGCGVSKAIAQAQCNNQCWQLVRGALNDYVWREACVDSGWR